MNLETENKKPKNDIPKKTTLEKVKEFLKNFEKNILWVLIGGFIMNVPLLWYLYAVGLIPLALPISLSFLFPITIVLIFYSQNMGEEGPPTFIKVFLTVCGGFSIGFLIWFTTGILLFQAPWALFHGLPSQLRGRLFLFSYIPSFIIGSYIMYKFGERRNWQPYRFFKDA
ncbi:MAG: membrane protein of unknown function [Promethearchaeota archaeon]|nr:MAG: membrane protein of unknown function [Candidatus Lokiarchaeota archaeon]